MSPLRRGSRLGKYRLERRLGSGASAEVWLGRDTVEGRKVAVKVIGPAVVQEFGRQEIEREARVAAHLEHPNILRIRNADWANGHFLLVSDPALRSLEGYTTARRSPELALSIIRGAAAGLAYAHEHRVLHRDIKPDNILLFPGGQARIADFGTARLAPQGTLLQTDVGTQGYWAPEQAYGRPRFASDVFSLGLTAYQLLAGVLPGWPFEWPLEGHRRFVQLTPEEVQPVLRRALQLPLAKRYTNAIEFSSALERALENRAARQSGRRPKRRTPKLAATPFQLETRWFRRHFGRALSLEVDCSACSGPISEAMVHCPWCGTDRNGFAEVTRYPLVCPDCDRGVRPEWHACPWCYAGRFESNGRQPPPDPKAERSCRKKGCDGQLRPFMRYCPMCKTKVSRPWKVEGLAPCPRCRGPVAARWRHCAWCGRKQGNSANVTS